MARFDLIGEAIAMPGDADYRAFAGEMSSYDFEPSLELDTEQIRRLGVLRAQDERNMGAGWAQPGASS